MPTGSAEKNRLADHLQSPEFNPNGQLVALGLRPALDGDSVFVVLKIEHCIDLLQAVWVAEKVVADVHFLLGAGLTDNVVLKHCYPEAGEAGWTAALGVELADRANADAFMEVMAAYADPGPEHALN